MEKAESAGSDAHSQRGKGALGKTQRKFQRQVHSLQHESPKCWLEFLKLLRVMCFECRDKGRLYVYIYRFILWFEFYTILGRNLMTIGSMGPKTRPVENHCTRVYRLQELHTN